MKLTQWIVNAVGGALRPPRPGRAVFPRSEDAWRSYPADGLTPSRLAAILRQADAGDLDEPMQLFEQMEEKDAHLFSVANTRRLALTGLDWCVLSASDVRPGVDAALADETAAYCREALADVEGFDAALQHLSLALGRNLSVAELVWDVIDGRLRLVEVAPVDFARLMFDDTGALRILTADEPFDGIPISANKFVVHSPHSVSGHPTRGGLLRVTALSFIAKQFAVKDWLVFAEVFGMPVRVARYHPSATPSEKRELLEMLRSLGSDSAGVFSKAVDLEIVQTPRTATSAPYEHMAQFFNNEMSKAWLGQTLTVDTAGASGTFAAAAVHDRVRGDLREDDMRKEARTIRQQVLRPMVALRFGPDAPVPFFRRRPKPVSDLKELAGLLSSAVNNLGMRVSSAWAHESLGIPQAGEGETVLSGER